MPCVHHPPQSGLIRVVAPLKTPKTGTKHKAAVDDLDSPDETPTKRRREESPDRPVGLTKKGLENMERIAANLRKRHKAFARTLELFEDQITSQLDGLVSE